jgi:predicted nucleotidyltransferase
LLDTLRKTHHADAIIVVLSGDFVQRGAPAITDKFTRTRDLLHHGADLVLELPARYSLSSAQAFARAGVATLLKTGIVDSIAFGTEDETSASELLSFAGQLHTETPEYQAVLRKHLRDGSSYPAARTAAIKNCVGASTTLLEKPNNILAVEYALALLTFESSVTPIPIKRQGTVSAHRIRRQRRSEHKEGIFANDFSLPFAYRLNCGNPPNDLEFHTELYNRLCQCYDPRGNLSDWILSCKTKQYTYTRISRCFFRYLLHLPSTPHTADLSVYAPYLRILGFRTDASALLGQMRANADAFVVQKLVDDAPQLPPQSRALLQEDLRCHDLYRTVALRKYPHWSIPKDYEGMVIVQP